MRRTSAALMATLLLLLAVTGPAFAASPTRRVSFTEMQNALMCVVCHEPLAVARSPEAYSENDYVRGLIQKGETKQQILHDMVQQYGPSVLASPPASGVNVLVYIVPPVVVLVGLIVLVITIPKWRRRAREAAVRPRPAGPTLSDEDTQRLNADLARER